MHIEGIDVDMSDCFEYQDPAVYPEDDADKIEINRKESISEY